jgi:imidazolonepropionase-like amidohydrolase
MERYYRSMRHLLLLLLLAATPVAASTQEIVITGVTVIDVERGARIPARTVVIRDGRIVAISPTRTRLSESARTIDGRGRFLIPGLWDMHLHSPLPSAERLLQQLVHWGVTAVRDMGSDAAMILAWRSAIASGTLTGPRIYFAGPILDGPLSRPMPAEHRRWRIEVTSVAQAERVVDSLAALGVDFIKVHERLAPEIFRAIVRRAADRGLHAAGHIPSRAGPDAAIAARLRSVEHLVNVPIPCGAESPAIQPRTGFERIFGVCATSDLRPLYDRFAAAGMWHTPTLVVQQRIALGTRGVRGDPGTAGLPDDLRETMERVMPEDPQMTAASRRRIERLFAKRVEQAGAMHRAGVKLLAGSDGPLVAAGWALHEELALLVRAGLTPAEALRAATLEAARYFGVADSVGTIAVGKRADLVLLDTDPLRDIRNTRRIRAVFVNGRQVR